MIQFPSWRVFFYLEEGINAIYRWFEQEKIAMDLRVLMQQQIDIVEAGGPETAPGCMVQIADGYHIMRVQRKGLPPITPICRYGPDGESEITFLAGAPIEKGRLDAGSVLPLAKSRYDDLVNKKGRRKRERIA